MVQIETDDRQVNREAGALKRTGFLSSAEPGSHVVQARLMPHLFGLVLFAGTDVGQSSFATSVHQHLAQPKSFRNVPTVRCGHPKFT
jgi:hypothetical protein